MSDHIIPTRALVQQGLIVSDLGLGCMGMSQSYGLAEEQESPAPATIQADLGMRSPSLCLRIFSRSAQQALRPLDRCLQHR